MVVLCVYLPYCTGTLLISLLCICTGCWLRPIQETHFVRGATNILRIKNYQNSGKSTIQLNMDKLFYRVELVKIIETCAISFMFDYSRSSPIAVVITPKI